MIAAAYGHWLARVREDIAAERVAGPVVLSPEAKGYCASCFLPLSAGVHDSLCEYRVEPNSA